MKTTINLPSDIHRQLKQAALDRDSTVTELIIEGIERVLSQPKTDFKLRSAAVGGSNAPLVDLSDWARLSSLAYEE